METLSSDQIKHFHQLMNFLLVFEEGKGYGKTTPEEMIEEFVRQPDCSREDILEIIKEGKELLAMNPFPVEWVESVTNGRKATGSHEYSSVNIDGYKDYIKYLIEQLEKELATV